MRRFIICLVVVAGAALFATALAQQKPTIVVAGDGGNNQVEWTWFKSEIEAEYNVNLQIVPLSFSNLYSKLKSQFVAQTGAYDIIVFFPKYIGDFASNGYIIPLTQYVKKWDPGLSDIVPAFNDLYDKWGNDIYAFPYDGDVLALFYRTDLFDNAAEKAAFKSKYGYELAPPETWQQYTDIAQFFTRKKGDKLAGQTLTAPFYGFALYGQKDFGYGWFLMRFASLGGHYFDADMNPGINSKAGVQALEDMKAMLPYAPPETMNYGFDEEQAAFLNGNVAMEVNWTDPGRVGQDPSMSKIVGKIGTALVPGAKQADGTVVHTAPMLAGRVIGVTRSCKEPVTCYKIARFMTQEASLAYVSSSQTGQDPFRLSAYQNPGAFDMFSDDAQAEQYLNGIKSNLQHGFPELTLPGTDQYMSALSAAVSNYLSGGGNAQSALDSVAKQWNDITNNIGRDHQKELWAKISTVWKQYGFAP